LPSGWRVDALNTIVVLDDFPTWSVYIPAIVVLLAFLLTSSMLLAALRRERTAQTDRRKRARSSRPLWLLTIASAVALWFMTTSMFLRFHAVGLDRSQLELFYLWPQPPVVFDFSDIVDVKLTRVGRNCGHLEIATRQERYLSVNFRKCDNAEAVIKQIPLRGAR
jgi:hypothetical protein